jgi:hypothetical protein
VRAEAVRQRTIHGTTQQFLSVVERGEMTIEEIKAAIARLALPISTAPRDGTPILVFMPAIKLGKKGKFKSHWRWAVWTEDHRDERSERRHDLMMKHDGYWAANKPGFAPLPYHPTHWLPELPDLTKEFFA